MSTKTTTNGSRMLRWSAIVWFCTAAIGQLIFAAYILDFYGVRTATGNFEGWNDRGVITGHVQGDLVGNLVFVSHVLLAVIVTIGGILQLMPWLRKRYPAIHRLNGKVFILVSLTLAFGGLWATWIRGSHLSIVSGLSVSVNGVLIIAFCALAYRAAIRRDFVSHEVWAVRAFLVVNGVWFFRIGLMAWIMFWQAPVGMAADLTGPADIGLSVGSYAIPLVIYEIYRNAKRSQLFAAKALTAIAMLVFAAITVAGTIAASLFMWFPAQ